MTSQSTVKADWERARFNMIEQQIRPWEVLDGDVLHLLERVRREDFVPASHRALAFVDMELPLTQPSVDGQVMLSPKVEARLLQDLNLRPTDRVLEVGTGSGHMAALLGSMAQQVVTLEMDEALARVARDNLQVAGVSNVTVRVAHAAAHGFAACTDGAAWDVIVLSGSVGEVPQALLSRLAPGGRLAAIVGHEPMMRATFVTRVGEASYSTTQPWDTVAPRLCGFPEPSGFHF